MSTRCHDTNDGHFFPCLRGLGHDGPHEYSTPASALDELENVDEHLQDTEAELAAANARLERAIELSPLGRALVGAWLAYKIGVQTGPVLVGLCRWARE